MVTLNTTHEALVTAVREMPETLKTRQILTDRIDTLHREVQKELTGPRIDNLTALLTLAWIAAAKSESAADCDIVAIMWMTERRQTAPTQVVHYYASMLENGYTPIIYPPRTGEPIDPPKQNVSRQIKALTEKVIESFQYVPRQYKEAVLQALTNYLQTAEMYLTAATGVRAIRLYQAAAQMDTDAATKQAGPPPPGIQTAAQ